MELKLLELSSLFLGKYAMLGDNHSRYNFADENLTLASFGKIFQLLCKITFVEIIVFLFVVYTIIL